MIRCKSKVPKFMLFKFVTLFQSFMPFLMPLLNIMLSIIFLLLLSRHYTPIIQCNRYFTHTTNRSILPVFHKFPLHLFTPMPLSYQHTLQPFSFSLDVFHSLPSNHTNQNAASITQIIVSLQQL